MALTKETTSSIVTKFGAGATDTGNAKVQIALITERIKELPHTASSFPRTLVLHAVFLR